MRNTPIRSRRAIVTNVYIVTGRERFSHFFSRCSWPRMNAAHVFRREIENISYDPTRPDRQSARTARCLSCTLRRQGSPESSVSAPFPSPLFCPLFFPFVLSSSSFYPVLSFFFLSSFRPARTNLAEIPQIRRCMPCVTYSKTLSYDTIGGSLAVCSRLSNPPSGSLVVLYNRSIIVRYSTVLLKPEREIFLSAPRLSIICYFRRDQFFLHMKVTKGDKVLFEGLKFRSVS